MNFVKFDLVSYAKFIRLIHFIFYQIDKNYSFTSKTITVIYLTQHTFQDTPLILGAPKFYWYLNEFN